MSDLASTCHNTPNSGKRNKKKQSTTFMKENANFLNAHLKNFLKKLRAVLQTAGNNVLSPAILLLFMWKNFC